MLRRWCDLVEDFASSFIKFLRTFAFFFFLQVECWIQIHFPRFNYDLHIILWFSVIVNIALFFWLFRGLWRMQFWLPTFFFPERILLAIIDTFHQGINTLKLGRIHIWARCYAYVTPHLFHFLYTAHFCVGDLLALHWVQKVSSVVLQVERLVLIWELLY